jgi:cytochrome c peroxidase
MLFHDARFCFEQWQSCASCHPSGRADGLNWDLVNDGIGNPKNTKSMLLAHRTPPAMISGVRPTAETAVRAGMTHILYADVPERDTAAIDEYLKSLSPIPSPHLMNGRLTAAANRGRRLFEDSAVGCAKCHPAPLYTDLKKHKVSPPGQHEHLAFDTPTLIEAWRTAPYSHDGRFTTVKALLVDGRHGRSRGGVGRLPRQQIDDLVQFVLSL